MQIILNFKENVKRYTEGFSTLEIERPKQCVRCRSPKIYKWGKYYRYVIEEESESLIPIQRIRCGKCRRTDSYLPEFCLSRIQYSADYVMKLLEFILLYGKVHKEAIKTQIYFFKARFLEKANAFISYLRVIGLKKVSDNPKERAIEIFVELFSLHREKKLIEDFFKHTAKHFMAK
jgi:hypothetical protein